jgi:hexokinase
LGRYKLGFTFSFPTIQQKLNSALLAKWTKVWLPNKNELLQLILMFILSSS